jgi:hypothetical protein
MPVISIRVSKSDGQATECPFSVPLTQTPNAYNCPVYRTQVSIKPSSLSPLLSLSLSLSLSLALSLSSLFRSVSLSPPFFLSYILSSSSSSSSPLPQARGETFLFSGLLKTRLGEGPWTRAGTAMILDAYMG